MKQSQVPPRPHRSHLSPCRIRLEGENAHPATESDALVANCDGETHIYLQKQIIPFSTFYSIFGCVFLLLTCFQMPQ